MRADPQVVHQDDIGNTVGEFHGTPIRAMSLDDVELREILDTQVRVRMSLGVEQLPVVLLSGEVLKDNLIRRATTREVNDVPIQG